MHDATPLFCVFLNFFHIYGFYWIMTVFVGRWAVSDLKEDGYDSSAGCIKWDGLQFKVRYWPITGLF